MSLYKHNVLQKLVLNTTISPDVLFAYMSESSLDKLNMINRFGNIYINQYRTNEYAPDNWKSMGDNDLILYN